MQQLYGLQLTAAPAADPVSLADAKLYGRVGATADDALITQLITAATRLAEDYTNRAFVTQSWLLTLDRFPGIVGTTPTVYTAYRDWPIFWDVIRLPKAPLASVDSVYYVDTAGATDLIDPSIWQADLNSEPGRLRPAYGKIWPVPRAELAAVQVHFTCGYGAASAVPAGIQLAIKVLVNFFYENRQAAGGGPESWPLAVRSLLDQYWVGTYLTGVGYGGEVRSSHAANASPGGHRELPEAVGAPGPPGDAGHGRELERADGGGLGHAGHGMGVDRTAVGEGVGLRLAGCGRRDAHGQGALLPGLSPKMRFLYTDDVTGDQRIFNVEYVKDVEERHVEHQCFVHEATP